MLDSIGSIVRQAETNYTTGSTTISKFVEYSQFDNLNKIEAYLNSKHISSAEDSLGREKPFFNIVAAAVNIWYRATNIARSAIRIKPTKKSHFVPAFIGTIHVQEWMKKTGFEQFLDEWGRTLARYGSALTKWTTKDGKLTATVVLWNRLICDTIEFDGNLCIEKLELTPAQLRKMDYDKDAVDALIAARTVRQSLDGQQRDNKDDYITLYEVHGELSAEYLKDENDRDDEKEDNFIQQMHVISFIPAERKDEFEDFTLYRGKEKNPYLMTHLIKEDGRTLGIGAVEHLFDAQWMTNHSQKLIKDQLDLASQLIFQTADKAFAGKNFLKSVVTGDIQVYDKDTGSPLTPIGNNSHDIGALQGFATAWQLLAKDITSTPDALRGNTMPSGTAFRQVALLNQEASSLFEVMTRSKKRYLEQMIREHVIPYIKKQMDTSEEIAATLESQDITKLDQMYVPVEARRRDNAQLKRTILSGGVAHNEDMMMLQNQIKGELAEQGNQRFIKPSDVSSKTWKQVLKDLEWEVEIEIQNKDMDKQQTAQNLIDLFKIIANPATLQAMATPQGKLLYEKILTQTNAVSPLELAQTPAPQPMPQMLQPQ